MMRHCAGAYCCWGVCISCSLAGGDVVSDYRNHWFIRAVHRR